MVYKQVGINKYGFLYDVSLTLRKLFKAVGLKLNFCEVDTFIQLLYYKDLRIAGNQLQMFLEVVFSNQF